MWHTRRYIITSCLRRPLKYVLAKLKQLALYKLVVHATSDRVLGMHVCDDQAGEVLQVDYSLKGRY